MRGDFQFPTAADYEAGYRLRKTDPVRVAERALEAARAIDRMEPPMRTFIALDAAEVRRQAEASAARWDKGAPLSPLDGVPVAVKDEYDLVGFGTTCGTKYLGKQK